MVEIINHNFNDFLKSKSWENVIGMLLGRFQSSKNSDFFPRKEKKTQKQLFLKMSKIPYKKSFSISTKYVVVVEMSAIVIATQDKNLAYGACVLS